ncbi:S8 family serine peptidase, partial [candidate division KSB1 bacterium]|nr:S8 family serine peptidase [candidate division KSB1 bacterium]
TNNGEIANNGIDDDGNGYIDDINGWDFVNDDNDPFDDHGHGTHVAGIVGAVGDNNIGIAGISWYGRLMALKSIGESGHGDVKAVEAIYYGTNNGVRILNNSWGGRLLFANSPRCNQLCKFFRCSLYRCCRK